MPARKKRKAAPTTVSLAVYEREKVARIQAETKTAWLERYYAQSQRAMQAVLDGHVKQIELLERAIAAIERAQMQVAASRSGVDMEDSAMELESSIWGRAILRHIDRSLFNRAVRSATNGAAGNPNGPAGPVGTGGA